MEYFSTEYSTLPTKEKINVLEAELNIQYNKKNEEEKNAQLIINANNNAMNAMFDGIKNVFNSDENAILFVSPMKCIANAFYKTVVNDGIKDVVNYYVCSPTDGNMQPIVTEDNFAEYMEPWDLA